MRVWKKLAGPPMRGNWHEVRNRADGQSEGTAPRGAYKEEDKNPQEDE